MVELIQRYVKSYIKESRKGSFLSEVSSIASLQGELDVADVEQKIDEGFRCWAGVRFVPVFQDFPGFGLIRQDGCQFLPFAPIHGYFNDRLAYSIGESANAFPTISRQVVDNPVEDFPDGMIGGMSIQVHIVKIGLLRRDWPTGYDVCIPF